MSNEEIVKRIQEGKDRKKNLSLLWEQNQKIINMIVHQITGLNIYDDGFEDAKQQAFLGLLDAVNSYSPESGTKFFSYAPYRIKRALYRFHANSGYIVRVPEYMKDRFNRLRNFRETYRKKHGKTPDDTTCMEYLKISKRAFETLRDLEKAVNQLRLDAYVTDSTELTYGETLESDIVLEEAVAGSIYLEELHREIDRALKILEEDGRQVILLHFYQGKTVRHIAEVMGCSRQSLYDRMEKDFKKIRESSCGEILQTFRDVPYQDSENRKRDRGAIYSAGEISESLLIKSQVFFEENFKNSI